MKNAKTLQEAREFFLNNSAGWINCQENGKEKICATYLEAVEFFKQLKN